MCFHMDGRVGPCVLVWRSDCASKPYDRPNHAQLIYLLYLFLRWLQVGCTLNLCICSGAAYIVATFFGCSLYTGYSFIATMASSTTKVSHTAIPLYYRYFFLYIEPASTILGAYYAFFQQQTYLDLTHSISAPITGIPMSTSIVLYQLSNLYLCFALNEALVLRATSDLRVWQTLLIGLLIADIGHLYSVNSLGLQIYWNFMKWNAIDWGNIGFVYLGASTRIAFLLGLGFPVRSAPARRRRVARKS